MIRVLLADDHQLFRAGVRRVLDDFPGINVVGEAGTGEDLQGAAVAFSLALKQTTVPGERARASYNLGVIEETRGNLDEADHHFKRTVEAAPDYAKAHYHLAILSERRRDVDGAINHLLRAIGCESNFGANRQGEGGF